MLLTLPNSLHYPITIRKIEKQVGEETKLRDSLFTYSYVTKVKQQDRYTDDEVEFDKTFSAHFGSTLEGTIEEWLVWEGDTIQRPRDILEMLEECKHAVQFNGMCVDCGRDLTGVDLVGDASANRATIRAAHDTDKLLISQDVANEDDEHDKSRLLAARKLSLVVDLDQTIIHAAVDPTIADWQKDTMNPNYESLQDVQNFQLIDDGPGGRGCTYYIKLRPGLQDFLQSVAEKYELHIYTMATRQYAQQIAKIVDPQRKYFDDRILSRDESGSIMQKSLARIFPVDTRMVVIIDDRGDVWSFSPNLIKVSAFNFFTGIGDINAGFLPKQEEIPTLPKEEPKKEEAVAAVAANGNSTVPTQPLNGEATTNGEAKEETSTQTDTTVLQQVVAMARPPAGDVATDEMARNQEETIANQLEEKPLLKLQQRMDEKDGVETSANVELNNTHGTDSESSDSDTSSNGKGIRHSIFRNDDEELIHLERSLLAVHERFYNEYDRKRPSAKAGRATQLSGKQKAPLPEPDSPTSMRNLPDVKKIMPAMKEKVLEGVTIAFSGVIPLHENMWTKDITLWAQSFGAHITDKVSRNVTHVIAARVGTAKVKSAVKKGIKVVSIDWLKQSLQRWKKLDERPFLLKGIGQKELPDDPQSENGADIDMLDETRLDLPEDVQLSEDEDTSALNDTDAETEGDEPKRKKLKLDIIPSGPLDPNTDTLTNIDSASPVELNADEWASIDDELKDFLGSDVDSESDAESVRSDRSSLAQRPKKRSRDDFDGGHSDQDSGLSGDERNGTSNYKRRKGTSALRAVANAESTGDNTPAPAVEREQTQDEYDAELAVELEAQFEAQAAAEAEAEATEA